jgi:hypothetical protein
LRTHAPCPECRANVFAEDDGRSSRCEQCGHTFLPQPPPVCPSCERGERMPLTKLMPCPSCGLETAFLRDVGIWD